MYERKISKYRNRNLVLKIVERLIITV